MRIIVACILILTLIGSPAIAADDSRAIQAAVKTCIDLVHNQGGSKGFDAFYNAATKSVENNANAFRYMPMQPVLFQFNKCMASQGFPLSYGNK